MKRILAALVKLFSLAAEPERIRLNADAEQLLGPWYRQYEGDRTSVRRINALVDEVLNAWKEWKRSGTSPDTARWSDNQCMLWLIVSKI